MSKPSATSQNEPVTARSVSRVKRIGMHWAMAAALAGLLSACAAGNRAAAPAVPDSLQVPSGQRLLLKARAEGVQIYVCGPTHDDPNRFDWSLKAPEAQLFDQGGKPIIKHYAGPSWEAADGSKVVGEVVARDNGPDPMAIQWLLLRAKSIGGNGILSPTQTIQRLNTVGGKPPQGGCGAGLAGSEVRVHYTANYLFYGAG
jgi:hypothetical protein